MQSEIQPIWLKYIPLYLTQVLLSFQEISKKSKAIPAVQEMQNIEKWTLRFGL